MLDATAKADANCGADALEVDYLSPEEIRAWPAYASVPEPTERGEALRRRLKDIGCWTHNQIAGKRWNIGCVALEITQRCNLDCTLCYLSDTSEAVKDVPLQELFRRIEMIYQHYGENTDVQVTGGDPTLRNRAELIQIVRRITERGMRASLFTNGIRATRTLLAALSEAGLSDVAFHVDLTQQRPGYGSEAELNAVREHYIERARGLSLSVFFNTTIFDGNFHEIPALVRFFRKHADVVRMASFQLQADTGRGVLRARAVGITPETVIDQLNCGAGTPLRFDTFTVGHPRCNRYVMAFEINGNLYDFFNDPSFIVPLMNQTAQVLFDRRDRRAAVYAALKAFSRTPGLWWKGARWLSRTLWAARSDLWAARGRINKLSFVIHNFMDGCRLERDRVHGCIFMVASPDGPISMCMHNAKRDAYILRPVRVATAEGEHLWDPLTGVTTAGEVAKASFPSRALAPQDLPRKYLKGRQRQAILHDSETSRSDSV
jgi:7,8-dihydro-6-hydroxymethylpterin dimethyltransferase